VLVCAYACDPELGSEQAVGWGWATMIARLHDVHVITGSPGRASIERELARDPTRYRRLTFHFVERHRWRTLERVWKPAYLMTYRRWQRQAYALARTLHERERFDLVHQVTYVGYRVPGLLWKLDAPFVWGPIGGLENTPWRLLPMLGFVGAGYYACRNLINAAHRILLRRPRKAFHAARGGILAATRGIQREIQRWYGEASTVLCEVLPPPVARREPSRRAEGEPLRLSWSGLHLPGKALPLLLDALAALPPHVRWTLDVLGKGECTRSWQRKAGRLGIADGIRWLGWVPREEALASVGSTHLFVITSVKDLTSTVVMEALALGVPVLCLDHCGFADVVDDTCGIKVPVGGRRAIQRGLADGILGLHDDEPRRRALAAAARARVEEFEPEAKMADLEQVYAARLASRSPA
jgi:glycosyltransferase involved in cell wall biosynthesis